MGVRLSRPSTEPCRLRTHPASDGVSNSVGRGPALAPLERPALEDGSEVTSIPDRHEPVIASMIAQGERNADAIRLIRAHCSHARVERSELYGQIPWEEAVGLPISVREMRCEHAPTPLSATRELLDGAIAFYEHNCAGCPHRDVQGVPNLKTAADAARERRLAEQAAQQSAAATLARERAERAEARAQRVADEPSGTRALIALLDVAVDAESPDRERGCELSVLCRLHPELCTASAGEVLLELAATLPNEELLEALGHLDAARKLDRDRLLAAALSALALAPVLKAARLVVELQDGLADGAVESALRSIVYLAAPAELAPGHRPDGDPAALKVAAARELPAVLDVLRELIGGEGEYERRVGAGAAAVLIEFEPAVCTVLVGPLLDALSLPDSMRGFWGSPRDEIVDALFAALLADPQATDAVLEARGRAGDDELRTTVFDVHERVLYAARHGERPPEPAAAIAVEAAFRRVGGDWGELIAGAAARLIASTAKSQPALLRGRVDQLFGLLISLVSASPQDRPTPGLPPLLAAMEVSNRRGAHAAVVRELRKALGALVPHDPAAVARNVMSVIEAPEIDSEEARALRDEAVGLLGDLGQRPELLDDVLPALWSALLHGDARVRGQAVEAWQRIAERGHRLPSELAELLPTLLRDQYVVVHRAVIRALRRGLPVPDSQLPEVVGLVRAWAHTYVAQDGDLLDELLDVLWSLAARLPPAASRALREECLQLAEHLSTYDKERFVEWRARGSEGSPWLAARLLEVARDRQRNRVGQRDDGVLRLLRGLDGPLLAGLGNEVRAAARVHLPHDPWEAERFIEILQRGGLWSAAVELAQEIRDSIPDDEEHAVERHGAEALAELAAAEQLLTRGEAAEANLALERSQRANDAQRTAIDRRPRPWETQ